MTVFELKNPSARLQTSRRKGAGKKVCRAVERVPRDRSGVPRGWMLSPLHFAVEATTPDKVQQDGRAGQRFSRLLERRSKRFYSGKMRRSQTVPRLKALTQPLIS